MVWKHSPAQPDRQTGCQVGIQLGRQVGREANVCREAEMRVRLSASAIYRDEREELASDWDGLSAFVCTQAE